MIATRLVSSNSLIPGNIVKGVCRTVSRGREKDKLGAKRNARQAVLVDCRGKILSLETLPAWRESLRQAGKRLAVTNGCFDLLHTGHVLYLQDARAEADVLLVGLNGDASVRELKGPSRPINPALDRAVLLAALGFVDGVCVFEDKRATQFLQLAQPDVYVKGGDYTLETLDADERRAVESAGGRICLMSLVPGRSTTTLVEKMVSTQGTEGEAAKLHLMGVVALQQGDWSQAHTLLQQALVKHPSLVDAWYDLGIVEFEQGNLPAAVEAYQTCLSHSPNQAEVHYNLGNAQYALGQRAKAQAAWLAAVRLRPTLALAHYNLGLVAQELGEPDAAVDHYATALQLEPDHQDAALNQGDALREARRLEEAIEVQTGFLKRHPGHPSGLNNLVATLTQARRYEKAMQVSNVLLEQQPNFTNAWINRGVLHQRQGDMASAQRAYQEVLTRDPAHADARYNLGMVQLCMGDYAEGFAQYEARWQTANPIFVSSKHSSLPLWDGQPLDGGRLLVQTEQGHGDAIQFARFIPEVARAGVEVVLQGAETLRRLLSEVEGVEEWISPDSKPTNCAAWCPLMSLPHRLGTTLESLPAAPYLKAQPAAHMTGEGLKVGFAWAGSAGHENDAQRSMPSEHLTALLNVPGICAFSLAVDRAPADARMKDLRDHISDFADTAACVAALDLVIAVDTAVAHLAGAMGKPVWVLIPHVPDWRWMLARADSPWYPSARLLRQKTPGDWPGVIERVHSALAERLIASR